MQVVHSMMPKRIPPKPAASLCHSNIEQGSLLKPKRIRTTFSEDQLQILNANFNLDPNPDGHDLERIAKQTGLSKRVTQVWFQNSRARQKKQSSNSGNLLSFIFINTVMASVTPYRIDYRNDINACR